MLKFQLFIQKGRNKIGQLAIPIWLILKYTYMQKNSTPRVYFPPNCHSKVKSGCFAFNQGWKTQILTRTNT